MSLWIAEEVPKFESICVPQPCICSHPCIPAQRSHKRRGVNSRQQLAGRQAMSCILQGLAFGASRCDPADRAWKPHPGLLGRYPPDHERAGEAAAAGDAQQPPAHCHCRFAV